MAPRQDGDWLGRLRPHLLTVDTPAQYLGGEVGQVVKDPAETDQRWALLFPDTYAIGMSHLGLKILYGILNGMDGVAAERGFAPWPDLEAVLRRESIPLLTLESHTPVREFDVVGFSLQYELCYTNVLAMLDLTGIPLLALDRTKSEPLVVGGGANAFHPEPLADFFDLFLLGDGEETVPAMVKVIRECRADGVSRADTIRELARRVPGLYAPAHHGEEGLPETIPPAHVSDLEGAYFPTDGPVPYVRVTQDRIAIEVMRGCTQGCRFCQAGMLKRPNRLRSAERVLEIAKAAYAAGGYDEISLLSLSTADYPHLEEALELLDREFRDRRVGLAVPSLRVSDALTRIPALVDRVRKSTLTLAPEAATDRLRAVINKNIANEDLYRGAEEIYRLGWKAIKLYFMIGLPTETDEDVAAIIDMGVRVSELGRPGGGGPGKVTISVANFVPKPHTPFQWEPVEREEELLRKKKLLFDLVRPHRTLRLKVHPTDRTIMESVLARGDRHIGRVLLRLLETGARFDAWDDHFDRGLWDEALDYCGVDTETLLHRRRDPLEPLPWDHLSGPVSREFLAAELERSGAGERTEHCMEGRCRHCGVDYATCKPARSVFRERGADAE